MYGYFSSPTDWAPQRWRLCFTHFCISRAEHSAKTNLKTHMLNKYNLIILQTRKQVSDGDCSAISLMLRNRNTSKRYIHEYSTILEIIPLTFTERLMSCYGLGGMRDRVILKFWKAYTFTFFFLLFLGGIIRLTRIYLIFKDLALARLYNIKRANGFNHFK